MRSVLGRPREQEAPSLPQLPEGWTQLSSPDGRPYYWNAQTNVTQWEKPRMGRRGQQQQQQLTLKITSAPRPADPDAMYTHGRPTHDAHHDAHGSPLRHAAAATKPHQTPKTIPKTPRTQPTTRKAVELERELEDIHNQMSNLITRKARVEQALEQARWQALENAH